MCYEREREILNIKYARIKERSLSPLVREARSGNAINTGYISYNCRHGNISPDLVVITLITIETKVLSGARNCAVHYSLDSSGGFSIYLRAECAAEIVGANLWSDIKLALV